MSACTSSAIAAKAGSFSLFLAKKVKTAQAPPAMAAIPAPIEPEPLNCHGPSEMAKCRQAWRPLPAQNAIIVIVFQPGAIALQWGALVVAA
jgi:hypothetical protein